MKKRYVVEWHALKKFHWSIKMALQKETFLSKSMSQQKLKIAFSLV